MSMHRAAAPFKAPRGCHPLGAVILALLVLSAACASDSSAEPAERAVELQLPIVAAHSEADTEERVFAVLPTNFPAGRISQKQFTEAIVNLILEMPIPVASPRPSAGQGIRIVRTSGSSLRGLPQPALAQGYSHFCAQRGTPGDCLNRLHDGPELDADDKRAIALALAVGPALEAANAETRAMISPTQLVSMVSLSITGYMALLLVPEPISKGVATAATILLWGYLGWELWDLLRAYIRLTEESVQATHFDQLWEAGGRFAGTIGPNSIRIMALVGTAAIGGTLSLSSKAPKLPGFAQVTRTAEAHGGLRATTAVAGVERVIISTPGGPIRAVLPRNAMAMSSQGSQGPAQAGILLSTNHRAFKSFRAFKRAMGSPGEGNNWHHIIEQHAANLKRFGPETVHNTENVIKVKAEIHMKNSAFYSSRQMSLAAGWFESGSARNPTNNSAHLA